MDSSVAATVELDLGIGGMTCASCVRRVEKTLTRVDGVVAASVNLANETATVSYDPAFTSLETLTAAVTKSGYTAAPRTSPEQTPAGNKPGDDTVAAPSPVDVLDAQGNVVGFEEKPKEPKSDLIPIGVYFLRPDAFGVIDHLAPSGRGEFEITDVLNHYIPNGGLFTRVYDGHWTDAGTVPSLLRAAEMAERDDADGNLAPPVERPAQ